MVIFTISFGNLNTSNIKFTLFGAPVEIMKYVFGNYQLDTHSEVLLLNNNPVVLEPKQYATLLLLCQSNKKIISRDVLLEEVWKGVIVSDNTINKHIAGLRKLLGDNAKSPTYITTVPRKGYRFIAELSISDDKDIVPIVVPSTQNQFKTVWLGFAVVLTLIVVLTIAFSDNEYRSNNDIVTLTRMEGNTHGINFHGDDHIVVFVNNEGEHSQLYRQNLINQQLEKIEHAFDSIIHLAGTASDEELYLVGKRLEKTILARTKISAGELKVELERDISDFTVFDIEWVGASGHLYFIAQSESLADRGLYSVDSTLTKAKSLHIPNNQVLFSRLDSDPSKKQLLVLGQLPNSTSNIYSYSFEHGVLEQVHESGTYIRDVIWHQDGFLYSDTPPSQRVFFVKPDSSTPPRIVATSSEYLCCETLYSDTLGQLIYRANTTNFQINWIGEPTLTVDNSSVYDMLPSLMHTTSGLVYASKRSGKSQLYYQTATGSTEQLTNFSHYRLIRAVDVSVDDKHVVSIADNSMFLHVIGRKEEALKKVFDNHSWLVDVSWLDDTHIVVKHQNKLGSWLEIYDLELRMVRKLTSDWHQVFSDQSDRSRWYAMHSDNGLVELEATAFLTDKPSIIRHIPGTYLQHRKLMADKQLFYQLQPDGSGLVQGNDKGQIMNVYPLEAPYGFDVSNSSIVISDRKYQSTNWHARPLYGVHD